MFRLMLIIVLVSASLLANAQFSEKLPTIRLSTHPKANAVVYMLDSVKYYFDRAAIIKLLKQDIRDTHYNQAADSAFLSILRSKSFDKIAIRVNDTIYKVKTGKLTKTNQSYWIPYLMVYLLFDGKVSIYEEKQHRFIDKMYVNFFGADGNIKGAYIRYRLYAPDGWLIDYGNAYNQELDFLEAKKFF